MIDQGWPEHLVDRAMRVPPDDCAVVPGSTPVVAFGHPLHPEVATLGINPSSGEFLSRDGSLLSGGKRRLATLDSLGVATSADIDNAAAAKIVDESATYFHRRPYHWFNALDKVLSAALGVSYRDDTAAHLDLVQWATDPVWRHLEDTVRARLLSEDRPFLTGQLSHDGYRLVVVAGKTACDWVQRAGLVVWKSVARLDGTPSATFYVGDASSPRFVGWSCNLQSQPGARRHIEGLIKLLAHHGAVAGTSATDIALDGLLPKGEHFRTRSKLITRLQTWLEASDAETIGDVTRFPRAPWVSFESPVGLVDLNADTQRAAIERLLGVMRTDPSAPWHVVANRRGRVNKVLFAPDDSAPGWYAYLRQPLARPTRFTEAPPSGRE